MKWLHPIGEVRAWLRWRESILVAEEDAAAAEGKLDVAEFWSAVSAALKPRTSG